MQLSEYRVSLWYIQDFMQYHSRIKRPKKKIKHTLVRQMIIWEPQPHGTFRACPGL